MKNAFSEEIYFSSNVGIKNGTAKEYVFNGSHKLSQLDWQVENLFKIGYKIDFYLKNTFLSTDYSLGLYNFGGKMEDYDWITSQKTYDRYSCHNLAVSECVDFSFDYGLYSPLDNNKSFIKSYLQIDFATAKFYAYDGWRKYTDEDYKGNEEGVFSGTVVTYNPNLVSFLLGFGGKYYFGSDFSLEANALLGLFSFGRCVDNHIVSKVEFVDCVEGGWLLKADFSLAYDFSNKHSLLIGGKLENQPLLKGNTFMNNQLTSGKGGFSSFFYEFYLSYRIRML